MKELPKFKYNPNAFNLDLNIFEKSDTICPVCSIKTGYKYTGPFYCIDDVENICPWCIQDGVAAKKYNGEFQDYASIEGLSADPTQPNTMPYDKEAIKELTERTPAYLSWQQGVWLGHCNDLCAFVGDVGAEEIKPIIDELWDDVDNSGYEREQVLSWLEKKGSFAGYLFKCLHCGKHRLHIDCD